MALTGCYDYSHGDVLDDRATDILDCFDAEGKAWLNLEIPLDYPATRATTYDDPKFVDGIDAEHAVQSMTIVLFHGTGEADARVASSYSFTTWTEQMDAAAQVTKTLQVTSDNIERGDNIYLLVILNYTPSLASATPFSVVKSTLTGVTTTHEGTDYFVMANAPLATANDGTGTVQTLVKLDPNFFFQTEAQALLSPAARIYVERAAAKVTVTETVTTKTVLGNTNIDFTKDDMRFGLYNYNDQSYLVRHFNSDWLAYNAGSNYRFVESAALPYAAPYRYRTYWAEDANYTGRDNIRTIQGWKEMDQSYYCAENTFDVANMTDENSTSVVVRIRVNDAQDFYTTSVTGSDVIYQVPANTVTEEGTSASSSFARRRSNYVSTAKTIDEYLREWLMETHKGFRDWVRDYAAGEPKHVNITVERDTRTEGGSGIVNAKVTAVTQTAQTSGTAGANAFEALELKTYIDNNITLNYYWKGYMFYRVPIRHFVDTETPWQSAATMTNNTTDQAYQADGSTTAEQRYLGRYGVVRNNWYNVKVTSVTHVGYPVIPPLTTDADDQVEQLLNATLQISGWEGNDIKL